jgi:hypothetical protein
VNFAAFAGTLRCTGQWEETMGYKTILVHCDAGKTTRDRAAVAAGLAERFDAHLVGLHVRQRFEAPMFSDATVALDALYRTYEQAVRTEEVASSAAFEARSPASGVRANGASSTATRRRTSRRRRATPTWWWSASASPSPCPKRLRPTCRKSSRCIASGPSWWCRTSA